VDFSILILTLNEEINLPACLQAVSWCDDIIVLDSFSMDRTREIAEKKGARFYQRKFDNFANQRNYALENIPFKHEWIFHLDADEIVTQELIKEIRETIEHPQYDAYRIPSKIMLYGKWLRYSGMYPNYQVRLSRHPVFRFRQSGHGQKEDIESTKIGTLKNHYLHYSFSKGFEDWFEKHNRYSSMEAVESLRHIREERIKWQELLSGDASKRRKALKEISYRLPVRPLFRFLYMYVFRLGFLDGYAGLTYCSLLSVYEYMIVLKIRESEQRQR
jgi:glycosyltransferase involved in cell wall biosynthesis